MSSIDLVWAFHRITAVEFKVEFIDYRNEHSITS
jgi:hypothetical protein